MKARPDQQAMQPGIRMGCRLGGGASIALLLLCAACKQSAPSKAAGTGKDSDPVAIRIGNREVHLSELQAEIDYLAGKRHPSAANLEAFLGPAIERLVALEKARGLGYDKDPEVRRQSENLLIGKLREAEIENKLRETKVTDSEIQDYFQRNQSRYTRQAQLHLALLFLSAPATADPAARTAVRNRMEEARSLALKLPQNTSGFGECAMTYSEEATSRFKGGDIGWLEAGGPASRWPDPVVKAGFALKNNGDISDVIETPEGFYLLKKLDSREPVVRSLDGRLRSSLEGALLKEKRNAMELELKEAWKQSLNISIHNEVLDALHFHSPKAPDGADITLPASP